MTGERSPLEDAIELAGGPDGLAAVLAELAPEDQERLAYEWPLVARPSQLMPPGDWDTAVWLGGRGMGKTRLGAENTRAEVEAGRARRIALVARTAADARDVIVEGESGILRVSPPWFRPVYEPSKRRLTWPNGAIATVYSADEPDLLRGPQHDFAWCDELAAWSYAQDVWDMLQFGLRLGAKPRAIVTTTPRPIPLIRRLLADPRVAVVRGRTFDNARNLPASFLATMRRQYEGTRLGRQELDAEVLTDNPGALFRRADIEAARVAKAPELRRIVIGVDPSGSSTATSDECGIIVAGSGECACAGTPALHTFVLADDSAVMSPAQWAAAVRRAYGVHRADRVVAEKNFGGDMVAAVLRAHGGENLPVKLVTASRGKAVRAEPIAALVEQHKVHFVGSLARLEDQLCEWDPTSDRGSPDRLDAFVWAATELMAPLGRRLPIVRVHAFRYDGSREDDNPPRSTDR